MGNAVSLEKMGFQEKTVGWECEGKTETVARLVQVDHRDRQVTMVMTVFPEDVVAQVKMVFQVHQELVDQMESPDRSVKLLLEQLE